MPQILDELPKAARGGTGGGRAEKHPYDEWFTGDPMLLVQGEDFDSAVISFRSSIAGAAKKRGIKVKTVVQDNGLAIQALGSVDAEPVEPEPIVA